MSKDMDAKWDQAFASPGDKVPVGDLVVCDDCNADYTNRRDRGGLMFESKALCPVCAPRWRRLIALYGEERHIRGVCPDDMPFADWVRKLRGPDAFIRVTSGAAAP
jgi:hypothetical protein